MAGGREATAMEICDGIKLGHLDAFGFVREIMIIHENLEWNLLVFFTMFLWGTIQGKKSLNKFS